MKKAVIFDFDGTLVDSEPNYAKSDVQAINFFGGSLTFEQHHQYIGMGSRRFIDLMQKQYGLKASYEEIRMVQDEKYLELARSSTPVFPEMKRLINSLKERAIPMAIASGTSQELLDILTRQEGLDSYFQLILSAEKVEKGKPAPDVYLKAAAFLGVDPQDCLVLEDSIPGTESALAAGMECITLPGLYQLDRVQDFPKGATVLKKGMEEFRAELVLDRVVNPLKV